jgi:hypothetical protein
VSDRSIRIGVRVLVAAIALLAGVLAILAFQPGTETHYPDELVSRDAGGAFIAAAMIATAAPGVMVWSRPRPWFLWAWTAIAVIASLVSLSFLDEVRPRTADVVRWTARAVELGAWVLAALATLGTLFAGFAIRATQVTYPHEAPLLAGRLRRFILGIAALGLVLVGVGLLPGQAVYDDANNCFGSALASLGQTEHHHSTCSSSYTELQETRLAGGLPLATYVLLLLAPAIVLYRDPRASRAWWWIVWSIGGLVASLALLFLMEFHLDLFSRTTTLWPARVVEGGMGVMQALLLVALPIMILRSREPRIPKARVVEWT